MVFDCEFILQTTIYVYFSMVKYEIEIFKELFRCADNKRSCLSYKCFYVAGCYLKFKSGKNYC